MSELEIALTKVRPYILDKLGWPDQLISHYGRVPVQIGTGTVWADFVCYISHHRSVVPWLLIEVKRQGESPEQAVPQAESYALIIRSPFFAVTDGHQFDFYMTGDSQGRSIKLDTLPSRPTKEYLPERAEFITFPTTIDELVKHFVAGLQADKKFFDDTKRHEENVGQLNQKIFQDITGITPEILKKAINDHVMIKPPNKSAIFKEIDEDFTKVRNFLNTIYEFQGDPEKIKSLCEGSKIRGGGIFFITQLLAGAHPNEYVILEANVSKALRHLGITDILVQNDTANGYIYINEICKKLYKEKLEDRLKEWGFGLQATHNFLWHYYAYYKDNGKWS
jgi:hypothetical protein